VTVTVGQDGKWTYTSPVLQDGVHTAVVTETDAAGNVSDPTTKTVDVGTIPPGSVTITNVIDDVRDDGQVTATESIADGNPTNDNTPLITGLSDTANSLVIVYGSVDGGPQAELGRLRADQFGVWRLQIGNADPLPDGNWTFTAYKL